MANKPEEQHGAVQEGGYAYTKQQFLASGQHTHLQKDMIKALLQENKLYTEAEVQQQIDQFMKQEAL
ncbi:hypothetical protein ACFOQM_03720 [Paenibacillus sp. GCM10012307]|uniref:Uncharacterized protein n=1 Tax=Paenibacillus roseus TaxID=2798579 RepID=A0A934J2T6_9BACL|nr:hypothetical protein [Paenibacillus roseus]MBJ6360423.1 hypothetical protein [Paenibacillus roseus]